MKNTTNLECVFCGKPTEIMFIELRYCRCEVEREREANREIMQDGPYGFRVIDIEKALRE